MRRQFVTAILAGLTTILPVQPGISQSRIGVGTIEWFTGSPDEYVLSSAQGERKVGRLVPLFSGDIIAAKTAGAEIKIDFEGGHSRTITRARSPYSIHASGSRLTRGLENLLSQLGASFSRYEETETSMVSLGPGSASKAFRFQLPGLSDGTEIIGSGQRMLGFFWKGGISPYHVLLKDPEGNTILDEDKIDAIELVKASSVIRLDLGLYTVEVIDSKGQPLNGRFEVVAPSGIPAQPEDISSHFSDAALNASVEGLWLAHIDGGKYRFEAYLRILPFALQAPKNRDSIAQKSIEMIRADF